MLERGLPASHLPSHEDLRNSAFAPAAQREEDGTSSKDASDAGPANNGTKSRGWVTLRKIHFHCCRDGSIDHRQALLSSCHQESVTHICHCHRHDTATRPRP